MCPFLVLRNSEGSNVCIMFSLLDLFFSSQMQRSMELLLYWCCQKQVSPAGLNAQYQIMFWQPMVA